MFVLGLRWRVNFFWSCLLNVSRNINDSRVANLGTKCTRRPFCQRVTGTEWTDKRVWAWRCSWHLPYWLILTQGCSVSTYYLVRPTQPSCCLQSSKQLLGHHSCPRSPLLHLGEVSANTTAVDSVPLFWLVVCLLVWRHTKTLCPILPCQVLYTPPTQMDAQKKKSHTHYNVISNTAALYHLHATKNSLVKEQLH